MDFNLSSALQWLSQHDDQAVSDLKDLLRIPSISSLEKHKADVAQSADWFAERMKQAGFHHVGIYPTPGHPIVYGDFLSAPHKPTVLIYGHYDVQPVDPESSWNHPPFEPTIIDDVLYARGSSDDKGQVYMQLIAAEAWIKTHGSLPINLKFIIEGEEEIGSPHLTAFIEAHHDLLQADMAVISDTPMFDDDVPSICYGLRGLAAFEISVTGPHQDLHSGVFGGAVANPAHVLADLISSLHTPDGKVAVPGFYDDVQPLSSDEKIQLERLPFNETGFLSSTGSPALYGEPGYSTLERIWTRPTLEVNGMWSGFIGDGRKTIIPHAAHAKITCRMVPYQDPQKILDNIAEFLELRTPSTIRLDITRGEGDAGTVTPVDHPMVTAAESAIQSIYHKDAAYIRMGGSIPIVVTLDEIFHIPTLLLGFALPNENFHAPNEHFHLQNFRKGAQTLASLWQLLGK